MRHAKIKSVEQENALYERARVLSQKLKIPFPEGILRVSLIREGGERELVIDRRSRSFTRNMYNWMAYTSDSFEEAATFGDGNVALKRVNGMILTTGYPFATGNSYEVGGANGFGYHTTRTTHGIMIGTDSTPETFDDYVLGVQIAHGTGAGEMTYSTPTRNEGWDAGTPYYYCNYERVFDNGSGGSITVNESALIHSVNPASVRVLMIRDKFSSGVAVADGEGIAVEYELRVNFP